MYPAATGTGEGQNTDSLGSLQSLPVLCLSSGESGSCLCPGWSAVTPQHTHSHLSVPWLECNGPPAHSQHTPPHCCPVSAVCWLHYRESRPVVNSAHHSLEILAKLTSSPQSLSTARNPSVCLHLASLARLVLISLTTKHETALSTKGQPVGTRFCSVLITGKRLSMWKA